MVTGWGEPGQQELSGADVVPDEIVLKPITREKVYAALEGLSM